MGINMAGLVRILAPADGEARLAHEESEGALPGGGFRFGSYGALMFREERTHALRSGWARW